MEGGAALADPNRYLGCRGRVDAVAVELLAMADIGVRQCRKAALHQAPGIDLRCRHNLSNGLLAVALSKFGYPEAHPRRTSDLRPEIALPVGRHADVREN